MKTPVSVTIEDKTIQRTKDRAEKDRRSFSEIVQFALEEYLK